MQYISNFEKAFDYVLANEEGYIFDKDDPGGETKFGISKRSYPKMKLKRYTTEIFG